MTDRCGLASAFSGARALTALRTVRSRYGRRLATEKPKSPLRPPHGGCKHLCEFYAGGEECPELSTAMGLKVTDRDNFATTKMARNASFRDFFLNAACIQPHRASP